MFSSLTRRMAVASRIASTSSTSIQYKQHAAALRVAGVAVRNYHERVIDHYENPRNVGSLDKSARNVGTGLV
jgi:hypothetical protein